eukprot:NODE_8894_length_675_cov_146.563406_g8633_i0.p1 GENE.NODE_8894_length_675_cov_146.563406_g8633_i0~~NODE_8894_length_675_cov_146.563406_g8633_i0.p1  ORF type:complete len:149 (+),score=8.89 NODE_8894_length_675_cov_146.563406_g8633_i0:57-503(+)
MQRTTLTVTSGRGTPSLTTHELRHTQCSPVAGRPTRHSDPFDIITNKVVTRNNDGDSMCRSSMVTPPLPAKPKLISRPPVVPYPVTRTDCDFMDGPPTTCKNVEAATRTGTTSNKTQFIVHPQEPSVDLGGTSGYQGNRMVVDKLGCR